HLLAGDPGDDIESAGDLAVADAVVDNRAPRADGDAALGAGHRLSRLDEGGAPFEHPQALDGARLLAGLGAVEARAGAATVPPADLDPRLGGGARMNAGARLAHADEELAWGVIEAREQGLDLLQ